MGFYVGAGIGNATLELEDADSPVDFKGEQEPLGSDVRPRRAYRVGRFAIRAEVEGLLLGFDDDGDNEADGDDWVDLVSIGFSWTF